VLLIYPLGLAGAAEYLPGRQAGPFDAARWWSGEICVTAQGGVVPGECRHPAALFGDHHQVLAEVPRELTGAAYRRARRAQPRPGGVGAEGMLTVIALPVAWSSRVGTSATVRLAGAAGLFRLAAVSCRVLVNRWLCREFDITAGRVAAAARDSLAGARSNPTRGTQEGEVSGVS
jgi:hypothetical protein